MAIQKCTAPALAADAPQSTAPEVGPNLTDAERLDLISLSMYEVADLIYTLRLWVWEDAARNMKAFPLLDRLNMVAKVVSDLSMSECDHTQDHLALLDSIQPGIVTSDLRELVVSRLGRG